VGDKAHFDVFSYILVNLLEIEKNLQSQVSQDLLRSLVDCMCVSNAVRYMHRLLYL